MRHGHLAAHPRHVTGHDSVLVFSLVSSLGRGPRFVSLRLRLHPSLDDRARASPRASRPAPRPRASHGVRFPLPLDC
jgi:hypothetical protein